MKLISNKLTLAVMATFLSLMSLFAHADKLSDIQKRGELIVAVPQDFPPFGSVGTDLKPQGYDIDTAQYLAEELDVKLKLIPVTSANRIPYLQTDKVDLVISSLGKTLKGKKPLILLMHMLRSSLVCLALQT